MKKTTKLTIIFSTLLVISLTFYAFKSLPDEGKKNVYMMITITEGKPAKMLITDENGVSTEMDIECIGRFGRLNLKDINSNNKSIVLKINSLAADGWTLVNTTHVIYGDLSFTRYLFVKQK